MSAAKWWPIGLATMTPAERVQALARGYWLHEGELVHRDGWKVPYSPSVRKAYPLAAHRLEAHA